MERERDSDSFIMSFYQMRIFLNIDIWSQFSQEDALIQYYLVENPTRISNILWDEDQSFLELLSYFSETSKRFSEVIYFSAVKIMCGQFFYFLLCKVSVIQFSDCIKDWYIKALIIFCVIGQPRVKNYDLESITLKIRKFKNVIWKAR